MMPKLTSSDETNLYSSLSKQNEQREKNIQIFGQKKKISSDCPKQLFYNLIQSGSFSNFKHFNSANYKRYMSKSQIQTQISHKPHTQKDIQFPKLYRKTSDNFTESPNFIPAEQLKQKNTNIKEILDFNRKIYNFNKKNASSISNMQNPLNFNYKTLRSNITEKPISNDVNNFKGLQVTKKYNSIETPIQFKTIMNIQTYRSSTGVSSSEEQSLDLSKEDNRPLGIHEFDEIKMLGSGCYGQVSLAKHKKTNLLVAIKKISKSSLSSNNITYLIRQIKIQSFSNHPNIIKLYTFFHDSANIYLVLQVCNEGNLYSILKNHGGTIPQDKVKRYIRHISTAVQFLHQHQILHRDLKPENILLHNGIAKICDFGWAVHAPYMRHSLCGTPLYACPELLKSEKYDYKIDIWNIGIMTYELICGKDPFSIRYQQDFQKVVSDQVKYPDDGSMSQECISFIKGCLEKNPKDRYEVWELLRHPFINIRQRMRQTIKDMWNQEKTIEIN